MRFGLKQQQQCPIGLDLGTHQVKLVQLEQKDTNWRMAAATSRTLPVNLPDAVPQRNDKLTSIIKEALDSSPFPGPTRRQLPTGNGDPIQDRAHTPNAPGRTAPRGRVGSGRSAKIDCGLISHSVTQRGRCATGGRSARRNNRAGGNNIGG